MKRFGFLMILAALAFPLSACSGGDAEDSGTGDSSEEQVEETGTETETETAAGAEQVSGELAAEKICCDGGCDAPAGYCCSDGTCGGSHEELPQVSP